MDIDPRQHVRQVTWSSANADDPIECFTRSELLARFPLEHFERVERLHFHLVILGRSGVGSHEVDFAHTEVRPGRVLHVEPGQVHRWRPSVVFDADVVLFREAPVDLVPRWTDQATVVDLDPLQLREADAVLAMIADERRPHRSPTERRAALRALRDLLFVRLGLAGDRGAPGGAPPAYRALLDDLERDLSVEASMNARAARLGYSARTLSRASREVTGRSAKRLVDERITLEARRLLAQPDATIAQVAATLGFTEQTNFAKFFRRMTGSTPSDWRASVVATDPSLRG